MRRARQQARNLILAACLMAALPLSVLAQTAAVSVSAVLEALQKGQYPDALRLSAELVRTEPQSYKAWTLRAVALEKSGQPKEALAAYEQALKLDPDYLPALEGAAQLSYKSQSAQAIPLLRQIVSLQPANSTAHAMLGTLEYRHGNYAQAAIDFAAADEAIRTQPNALMAYALCLAHVNRFPDAIARLQQVLVLRPNDAEASYDLALLQWRSDDSAAALSTLQPLLDARAADGRTLRLAAAIHESNGETPNAVELLRTAILANPDDPNSYVEFATLSFTHGSYAVGIDMVNIGLTRLPNSAALYMARGVLYGQNGDFEKAMADFEHAHKLDPGSSMASSAEGIAQSQRHNHEAALQDFRRQVREHPRDALAYYLLAEALSWSSPDAKQSDDTNSVAEAISTAKKSIVLDPHLAEAYDLLASLELQADQHEQAVKACRAALAINPKDQQAVYSLILARRKTGDKAELKDLVQRLTDLRKAENEDNNRKSRYGQLIEAP
ncbi:MAG: tetratricopeptide repeat protein [Terracidiphilus sp.]